MESVSREKHISAVDGALFTLRPELQSSIHTYSVLAHGADCKNVVAGEAKEKRGGREVVIHRDGHSGTVHLPPEGTAGLQEHVKYHPRRASERALLGPPEFLVAP